MYALNQLDSLGVETEVLEHYRTLQAAGYGTESDDWRPDLAPDDAGPEYFGLEGQPELDDCDDCDQFGGWNPFKAIAHAATSVAKVVTKVPGISHMVAAPRAALSIARGENVLKTLKREGVGMVADVRRSLPLAAGVVSYVPGVGTGVASGLSAVSAASQGKSLRGIAEEAAIGAVPGGQLYKAAIQASVDVARGKNVLKSVTSRGLELARSQIPGGELGQRAFNVGLNVAKGGNVARSVASEGISYARSQLPDVAQRALSAGINVAQGGNVMRQVVTMAPLAKAITSSPIVKVGPRGAAFQFSTFGVPPSAAIAATTAITEAAESTVPGIAAAAQQVIENTRAEADSGNDAAAVALGTIEQAIASRMALRSQTANTQSLWDRLRQLQSLQGGYR